MERVSFNLPNDPDQKKVAAASLTATVALLMSKGVPALTALQGAQEMYSTILGEQTTGEYLNTWEKLGD